MFHQVLFCVGLFHQRT